ncbi:TRAP transporter large permease subunit [bacterium]|nr:TRAP transporter large permease subunit [bacterium]
MQTILDNTQEMAIRHQDSDTGSPVLSGTDYSITRVLDLASNSMGIVSCFAILAMVLMISYEVLSRYLFNEPTSWVTEYSLYILVGIAFLSAGYAHLCDSHIRVEILLNYLSEHRQRQLKQITAWLGFVFSVLATWQMIIFVHSEFEGGAKAWGLLATPLWIPEASIAVGLGVFSLALLSEILKINSIPNRWREVSGLVLLGLMTVGLFVIGVKPMPFFETSLEQGTVLILAIVLIVAWLWSETKIALFTMIIPLLGGFFFMWGEGLSIIARGGVIAVYVLFLMAIGVRIAFALGLAGTFGLIFFLPFSQLQVIAERSWTSVNSFAFTAIPMFILMGAFLLRSGVSSDLFKVLLMWMGRFPGGIAHATVGACGIFAAVSGSSLATAATMGMTAGPEMIKNRYSPRLAYGVVAAGGTLGILIPPSIAMIIYGSLVGIPIGELFMAGVVPGVVLISAFMIVVLIWSIVQPNAAPRGQQYTWAEKIKALTGVLPFLVLIAGVLGSLYLGVATPTESGALGALIAALLCVNKKKMTVRLLFDALLETAQTTSFLIIIVVSASIMGYTFDYIALPKTLVASIIGTSLSPGMVIAALVVIYIILGMFIDSVSMMLMTWSVSVPLVTSLGFDPTWFGVFFVMMIEIGLITPPVGMILFVLQGMSEDADLKEIVFGVIPFVFVFLAVIFLFYLFPELVLWLPHQMSGVS